MFTLEDLGNILGSKQVVLDCGKELTRIVFTKENVVGELRWLKTDKSPGIGELYPKSLGEVKEEMEEGQIFNISMQTGDVPWKWSDTLTVPLLKEKQK